MTLNVGQKVYYPGRGPCLIGAVVRKVICGASAKFYSFNPLDDSGTEFLVPVGNFSNLGLRALLSPQEIPELLKHLKARVGPPQGQGTWQQRESTRSKLFSSGSPFELADLVQSLTRSSSARKLTMDERESLRRAKKLLVCEIAEVMNESTSAAESRVDRMLDPDGKSMDPAGSKFHFRRRRTPQDRLGH